MEDATGHLASIVVAMEIGLNGAVVGIAEAGKKHKKKMPRPAPQPPPQSPSPPPPLPPRHNKQQGAAFVVASCKAEEDLFSPACLSCQVSKNQNSESAYNNGDARSGSANNNVRVISNLPNNLKSNNNNNAVASEFAVRGGGGGEQDMSLLVRLLLPLVPKTPLSRRARRRLAAGTLGLACFLIGVAVAVIFIGGHSKSRSQSVSDSSGAKRTFPLQSRPIPFRRDKSWSSSSDDQIHFPHADVLKDLFISVKTTKKYHHPRLVILLETWVSLVKSQTYFFTDLEDKEMSSRLFNRDHLVRNISTSMKLHVVAAIAATSTIVAAAATAAAVVAIAAASAIVAAALVLIAL